MVVAISIRKRTDFLSVFQRCNYSFLLNLKNFHKNLLLNLSLELRYNEALNKIALSKATSVHFRIFDLKTFGFTRKLVGRITGFFVVEGGKLGK